MKREVFSVNKPTWLATLAPVAVALLAYSLLAFPLRDWLIDDAAISMAYAANLTAGHGLVAQPGLEPVEGYSNPLWVGVLALLNLVGLMTVGWIKLLSLVLVGLSLVSLSATCREIMPARARFLGLALVATDSSIVTWTTSGLENPLTLLLVCELLRSVQNRRATYAGLIVAALALNRPEGLLLGVFPALFLRGSDLRRFSLILGGLFAAFLAARFTYFGDVVPNTFHAKVTSGFSPVTAILNLGSLVDNRLGIVAGMLALLAAAWPKRDEPALALPLALMFVAAAIFVLMPADWMPDRRFATPFIPAAAVFAGFVIGDRLAMIALALAVSVGLSIAPLKRMYAKPTTPMSYVIGVAQRFNTLGGQSILLPDIGGALLTSKLRVYDLAGLTDKTIARTLYNDKPRFREYVFGRLKPTYIKTHTVWTSYAQFDRDPRFARDYVRIADGEYVRRDYLSRAG